MALGVTGIQKNAVNEIPYSTTALFPLHSF